MTILNLSIVCVHQSFKTRYKRCLKEDIKIGNVTFVIDFGSANLSTVGDSKTVRQLTFLALITKTE